MTNPGAEKASTCINSNTECLNAFTHTPLFKQNWGFTHWHQAFDEDEAMGLQSLLLSRKIICPEGMRSPAIEAIDMHRERQEVCHELCYRSYNS
jgi:hypothetical protein